MTITLIDGTQYILPKGTCIDFGEDGKGSISYQGNYTLIDRNTIKSIETEN